ncbi:MAG: hypothetical protein GY895_09475, partial [Phycisphaera sp.]|nr:hypothetical protein [Phycisphaera sp.]
MRSTFISRPFITRATLIAGLGLTMAAHAEDVTCRADLDGDQVVAGSDFGRLLTCWGECGGTDCTADIDGSGCVDGLDLGLMLMSWGPVPAHCLGPTPAEPFHMPTMTDTSTLDVVVLEDWHVDTLGENTRQKLIEIHVDDWWPGVEIRVPVRLVVPRKGTVEGFVINGSGLNENPGDDETMSVSDRVALDAGVGVVTTKIKSLGYYPDLPPEGVIRTRFAETLDYRYSEYYLWGAIMMRSITAAFDEEVIQPGPVIAYGNSKNGMTPLIASIHDERITAVRSTHAFTT